MPGATGCVLAPNSAGLQPTSDGLHLVASLLLGPSSDALAPSSAGARAKRSHEDLSWVHPS